MGYDILVKQLAPQPVAATVIPGIRIAAVGAALHGALPDVFSHLQANGIEPAGPPFARFHHCDADTIDVEIGLPVPADATVPETDTIKAGTLPGGDVATTTGTADDLAQALQAIGHWAAANARTPSGPSWVSYLDQVSIEVFGPIAPEG